MLPTAGKGGKEAGRGSDTRKFSCPLALLWPFVKGDGVGVGDGDGRGRRIGVQLKSCRLL